MTDSETPVTNTNPTPPMTPEKVAEEVKQLTPINTRPLLIAGGAAVAVILLLLLLVVFTTPPPQTAIPSPLPSAATASASPQTDPVSEIGKTENFQKFEQNLNTLRAENEKIDLSEAALTFPLLDMNVNFDQNL